MKFRGPTLTVRYTLSPKFNITELIINSSIQYNESRVDCICHSPALEISISIFQVFRKHRVPGRNPPDVSHSSAFSNLPDTCKPCNFALGRSNCQRTHYKTAQRTQSNRSEFGKYCFVVLV